MSIHSDTNETIKGTLLDKYDYNDTGQIQEHRFSIPRKPVPSCSSYDRISNIPSSTERLDQSEQQSDSNNEPEDEYDALHAPNTAHGCSPSPSSGDHSSIEQEGGNHPDRDDESVLLQTSVKDNSNTRAHAGDFTWTPYTLKWPFMLVLISVSLGLSLTVGLLTYYSTVHTGFADDAASKSEFFGWRFSPTLVAVVYVLLETMLLVDLRRTEVFARLARNRISPASTTILHGIDFWWNDPREALRRQPDGGWRGWALFWASIANISGMLVISPLSAGLLSAQDVQIATATSFSRISASRDGNVNVSANDATYLRTIAGSTLGLTTSAWIDDEYTALPFWPASCGSVPLGSSLALSPQMWQAKTTVFQVVLECSSMQLSQAEYQPAHTAQSPRPTTIPAYYSTQLTSTDGCVYEFSIGDSSTQVKFFERGGGWWSDTSNHSYPTRSWETPPPVSIAHSEECHGREVMFFTTPFQNASTKATGQVCRSSYYQSEIEAMMTISATQSELSFDRKHFDDTKRPISAIVGVDSFQSQFNSSIWSYKVTQTPPGNPPVVGGPLLPIAALSNFDLQKLMESSDLSKQANIIKQRFFGELLQDTYRSTGLDYAEPVSGQTITVQLRVVAQFTIGITLTILFLLSGVLFMAVFYCSRPCRRPLGVSRDPGSLGAVTTMMKSEDIRLYFNGTGTLSDKLLHTTLQGRLCRFDLGELSILEGTREGHIKEGPSKQPTRPWYPVIMSLTSGICALCFFALLIAGIIALFVESQQNALYRTFFVYRKAISIGNGITVSFAPYSIIPTLPAVIVKLWWGSLEGAAKRLQPYISLARRPTKISKGVALSYMDSLMLWTSWEAFRNRHWILSQICFGAFLAEIFTIGMSALYVVQDGTLEKSIRMTRQMELRTVPTLFSLPSSSFGHHDDAKNAINTINTQLYGNALNGWLYGGLVDLVYNGSRPSYTSRDHWAFAPIFVSNTSIPQGRASSSSSNTKGLERATTNITYDSTALRARLECTQIDLSNTSLWLQTLDFQNTSRWNTSTLIPGLETGYTLSIDLTGQFSIHSHPDGNVTSFFTDSSEIHCCANMTEGSPGEAAIGYWSINAYDPWSPVTNFTVKWITGRAYDTIVLPIHASNSPGYFVWHEPPKMTALNCMPVIENADATITVDASTGAVQDYDMKGIPTTPSAPWSDAWNVYGTLARNEYVFTTPEVNVTVSYGWLFQQALLTAADWYRIGKLSYDISAAGFPEELTDRTYNFRQTGLNADFMSFSSLALVENNVQALLDAGVLYNVSNTVFGTFFQHFITQDLTQELGSYGFQPANTTELWNQDLTANKNSSNLWRTLGYNYTGKIDSNGTRNSSSDVAVTLYLGIQQLHMSPLATYLCLIILIYLSAVTTWVYVMYRRQFSVLPRDMDSLASVLALVYTSPRLQAWTGRHKHQEDWGLKQNGQKEPMAMLGPFDGDKWGVELVDNGDTEVDENGNENSDEERNALRTTDRFYENQRADQEHEMEMLATIR